MFQEELKWLMAEECSTAGDCRSAAKKVKFIFFMSSSTMPWRIVLNDLVADSTNWAVEYRERRTDCADLANLSESQSWSIFAAIPPFNFPGTAFSVPERELFCCIATLAQRTCTAVPSAKWAVPLVEYDMMLLKPWQVPRMWNYFDSMVDIMFGADLMIQFLFTYTSELLGVSGIRPFQLFLGHNCTLPFDEAPPVRKGYEVRSGSLGAEFLGSPQRPGRLRYPERLPSDIWADGFGSMRILDETWVNASKIKQHQQFWVTWQISCRKL